MNSNPALSKGGAICSTLMPHYEDFLFKDISSPIIVT